MSLITDNSTSKCWDQFSKSKLFSSSTFEENKHSGEFIVFFVTSLSIFSTLEEVIEITQLAEEFDDINVEFKISNFKESLISINGLFDVTFINETPWRTAFEDTELNRQSEESLKNYILKQNWAFKRRL